MRSVRYIIPGNPVPLARARNSCSGKVWDSQKQMKFAVGIQLRNQHQEAPPLTGPLQLDIEFHFLMPNTHKKKWDEMRGSFMHFKPDTSNLIKFYEDVAEECGLFANDCQIVALNAKKIYNDEPLTIITITELK